MKPTEQTDGVLDDPVLQTEGGSGIALLDVAREIKDCLDLLSMERIRPDGMTDDEVQLELAKGIAPLVRKLPELERKKRIKELIMDAAETLRNAKKTGAAPAQGVIVLTMSPDESPRVTSTPGGMADAVKSALRSLFSTASRAAM